MNLPQLQYFVALAEHGRLTDAAKDLFIAQSTLSNAVKSLEDELDVRLFDRSERGFSLTANGEVFYRYISHALSTIEEGKRYAKNPRSATSSTIALGIEPLIRKEYARVAIATYLDAMGEANVEFTTSVDSCEAIMEGLREGTYDAGMVLTDVQENDLLCWKVGKYSLAAVFNVRHPFAHKASISMADIAETAAISYHPASPLARQIRPFLDAHGIQVARYLEDDSTLCGELCRDDTVVALMRSTSEISMYPQLTFRAIEDTPECPFGTYFLAKKPPYRTDDVERFITFISTINFPSAERIVRGISA